MFATTIELDTCAATVDPQHICGNCWSPDIHTQPQLIADIHAQPLLILTIMCSHRWSPIYMCLPLIPNIHVLPWICAATLDSRHTWRATLIPSLYAGPPLIPAYMIVWSVTIDTQHTCAGTLNPRYTCAATFDLHHIYDHGSSSIYMPGQCWSTYMCSHHWSPICIHMYVWSPLIPDICAQPPSMAGIHVPWYTCTVTVSQIW